MTILDPEAGLITIINTYQVDPRRADELVRYLTDATHATLSHVPGFVSANFHIADDRTQVINYAQWRSHEAIAVARENSEVAAALSAPRIKKTAVLPDCRLSAGVVWLGH